MKFKYLPIITIIVGILLSPSLSYTTHSNNSLKGKLKSRSTNKLDYLNYMANYNKNIEKENKLNSFKFKSMVPEEKTLKYNATEGEIFEEWFIISSDEFTNIKRFPKITLANGKTESIKINSLNFRINHASNCTDPARPPGNDDRQFYFRLNKNSLYYSSTKTDINILGFITVKDIYDVDQNNDISGPKEYFCFMTKDEQNKEWKICHDKKEITEKWYCLIKLFLGKIDGEDVCFGFQRDPEVEYKEKIIRKPIIMVPLPSPTCNENWDYQRQGEDWVCECKDGVEQSPIDLPETDEAQPSPVKPIYNYVDVDAINEFSTMEGVMNQSLKLEIFNTDNMIHIMHYDMGKVTTLDGTMYQAQEITFHIPSNHQIGGKSFAMEMVVIHFGITKGDIGKYLTLSFLFEEEPGVYNSFLEDLDYFSLPNPMIKKRGLQKTLFIPKVLSEEADGVGSMPSMKPFSFYTYTGSLPFPPCAERTIVYVASTPLRVSSTTIALFKEAMKFPDLKSKTGEIFNSGKKYNSNRIVQKRNGRPVYWYDHTKYCPEKPVKPKKSGHYEKVTNAAVQYFYVGGNEPSGMPGAFVVSEREAKGEKYDDDKNKEEEEKNGHRVGEGKRD